jgi:hypothetical protein
LLVGDKHLQGCALPLVAIPLDEDLSGGQCR